MISYTKPSKIFVKGGFVTEFGEDYFSYITLDFDKVNKVKYKDVLKMWVGSIFEIKNDWISLVPTTNPETKYQIKVAGYVIYNSLNTYNLLRYKTTIKYIRLIKWCEYFLTNYEDNEMTEM